MDTRLSIGSILAETADENIQPQTDFVVVRSRPQIKRLLPLIVATISLVGLLYLAGDIYARQIEQKQNQYGQFSPNSGEKKVLGLSVAEERPELPLHLIIPAINVNADVQNVGITSEGEMETPDNISDVGWYMNGSRPGERGSAVIDGHFDGENGEPGVFTDLDKLKEGDLVYIQDADGKFITFIVRGSRIYDPGHAEDVFNLIDSPHLNLITCHGVWNEAKESYNERLVVFADIVN